jgi:hypothetical protein
MLYYLRPLTYRVKEFEVARAKNDMESLARAARAQLARASALGRSLDVRMQVKLNTAEGWVPDDSWRSDYASVTATIVQCGQALTKALENNKKALGSMTTEQLEAQLRAELPRIVAGLDTAEWCALVASRQKAGL